MNRTCMELQEINKEKWMKLFKRCLLNAYIYQENNKRGTHNTALIPQLRTRIKELI